MNKLLLPNQFVYVTDLRLRRHLHIRELGNLRHLAKVVHSDTPPVIAVAVIGSVVNVEL